MSVKNTVETTSNKVLNSDIYDITSFVNDIKTRVIDSNVPEDTLMVGIYGYLGYQFSSLLQNAIVTASELSNEAIPTRAKFDRNVITHALSLGVNKVSATPANMKVLMLFPERALRANMIDGKFTLKATTPFNFEEFEFHLDYDITITYVELANSTNGSDRNYVYTATYDMTNKNPISELDNPFLPPISVFNYKDDTMVALATNIHQVYYEQKEEKIIDSDVISNKTINFGFEKQMSHFSVKVKEPMSATNDTDGKEVVLIPVYDGLYNREISEQKYCYYQYINPNTIRIRFDPNSYQPTKGSDVIIDCYTTDGYDGNFDYRDDLNVKLTSDRFASMNCVIVQRGNEDDTMGSYGGLNRLTVEELQHIIPKEALSRGSITTNTDLTNFFNSLNNENSVLHVFRKEDNILDRIYYVYNLMKDKNNNIVPTNTIPIYVESTRRDTNGKIYLESGTPIYYYKFGNGANIPYLRDNNIGYLQQKFTNVEQRYSFYLDNGYTTYQGTPDETTLNTWATGINEETKRPYSESFDANLEIPNFKYSIVKPDNSYNFHQNSSIYYKEYNRNIDMSWKYGVCSKCKLEQFTLTFDELLGITLIGKNYYTDPIDVEIMWQISTGPTTTTYNFPRRSEDPNTKSCVRVIRESDGAIISNVESDTDLFAIVKVDDNNVIKSFEFKNNSKNNISSISLYRKRGFREGEYDYNCVFKLPMEKTDDIYITIYGWFVTVTSTTSKEVSENELYVVDYITDITSFDEKNKIAYGEFMFNLLTNNVAPLKSGIHLLDSINTVDMYSYEGNTLSDIVLAEGDLIRFIPYDTPSITYDDPSTWLLGEVLSIERKNNRIVSIEVFMKDPSYGFISTRYIFSYTDKKPVNNTYITTIMKVSKFLYTTPLSIVLNDRNEYNSNRITASYYLDIINETRYQKFDCINSKSPMQFILPNISVKRRSYLSDNRYKYTIGVDLSPNVNMVTDGMINRTQVIGVLYKKDDINRESRPVAYTIADYMGPNAEYLGDDNIMPFEFSLYSAPFSTSSVKSLDGVNDIEVIDDDNNLYIGPAALINDVNGDKKAFFDAYHVYNTDSDITRPQDIPPGFDLNNLPECYATSLYLNLNTELKIYVLYKYKDYTYREGIISQYMDGLSNKYMNVGDDSLLNCVSGNTAFDIEHHPHVEPVLYNVTDEPNFVENYCLRDMTITNVYSSDGGINLLYDYSNIMNSYVTALRSNDIFNPDNNTIDTYVINRVPCIRYFYCNTEERLNTFIKDMKRKINYVLEAISPLEVTFGLDYKFFNTYGPSNMYHLTNSDGDTTKETIDNVALTMSFRVKFYTEDSETSNTIIAIKNRIKEYLEKLDQLDDIHFPNITTMIESEFSDRVIYFEFISFNVYDATTQHIISTENMEMLSMVPEFLHVDTDDNSGEPYINIRITT